MCKLGFGLAAEGESCRAIEVKQSASTIAPMSESRQDLAVQRRLHERAADAVTWMQIWPKFLFRATEVIHEAWKGVTGMRWSLSTPLPASPAPLRKQLRVGSNNWEMNECEYEWIRQWMNETQPHNVIVFLSPHPVCLFHLWGCHKHFFF